MGEKTARPRWNLSFSPAAGEREARGAGLCPEGLRRNGSPRPSKETQQRRNSSPHLGLQDPDQIKPRSAPGEEQRQERRVNRCLEARTQAAPRGGRAPRAQDPREDQRHPGDLRRSAGSVTISELVPPVRHGVPAGEGAGSPQGGHRAGDGEGTRTGQCPQRALSGCSPPSSAPRKAKEKQPNPQTNNFYSLPALEQSCREGLAGSSRCVASQGWGLSRRVWVSVGTRGRSQAASPGLNLGEKAC